MAHSWAICIEAIFSAFNMLHIVTMAPAWNGGFRGMIANYNYTHIASHNYLFILGLTELSMGQQAKIHPLEPHSKVLCLPRGILVQCIC